MSLFSVLDPSTSLYFSMNWISLFIVFIFIPMFYFYMSSNFINLVKLMLNYLNLEFKVLSSGMGYGLVLMVIGVFLYLLGLNLLGMFPFVFSSSSHPSVTMSVGLVLWFGIFLMGWLKRFFFSCAHLVPEGSPMLLSFFMVVIESISHLIRPFTLSIRLAANMMAGHLIIGLLSTLSKVSFLGIGFSILFQSLLMLLELGVCFIQGFVFSILLMLYILDYY